MIRKSASFAVLLPVLAVIVSASLVLLPAMSLYTKMRKGPQTQGRAHLQSGAMDLSVPQERVPMFAAQLGAVAQERTIVVLNTPACFPLAVVGLVAGQRANWYPANVGPSLWRVLAFPLLAIPAWWMVGKGLDRLLGGRLLARWIALLSAGLSCAFLVISVALRFGLSAQERDGQYLLSSYIAGFALWAVLFALPFAAWLRLWLRQRKLATVSAAE